MAKVTITLEDNPATGNVKVSTLLPPTYNVDNPTAAEYLAMQFIMQCDDEAKKAGS